MLSANDISPTQSHSRKKIDCIVDVHKDDHDGDKCKYIPLAPMSISNNARAPKRPAHRLPWPRAKKICSYDKSQNPDGADNKIEEEDGSHDAWSDSDTSSIVHVGSQSKIEACILKEDVEVLMVKIGGCY